MCNFKSGKIYRSKYKESGFILRTLVIFCLITAAKSAYSDESESDEQSCLIVEPSSGSQKISNSTDVLSLIKEGEEYLNIDGHSSRAILILGNTGVGKTTLSLTIHGNLSKLHLAKTPQNKHVVFDEDKLILPSLTSKTLYPNYIVNPRNNVSFYDCPGFNDIRAAEEDIATTYFTKAVADHLKEAKFLLVAKHSDVTFGDRNRFLTLTKHVARLLKNTEKFNHSIGLVVTRVDSTDSDKPVIENIGEHLNGALQSLKDHVWYGRISESQRHEIESQIIIVESILARRTNSKGYSFYPKIGIFRTVTKCGPFDEKPAIVKFRNNMIKMYSKYLRYANVTPSDFGFTLKDSTSDKVRVEVIPKIRNQIEENVKNISEPLKIQYVSKLPDKFDSADSAATFFSSLEETANNLNTCKKPSEYLHKLATDLSLFLQENETVSLQTEENLLSFFVNVSHHGENVFNHTTRDLVEHFQLLDKFKEKVLSEFIPTTGDKVLDVSVNMSNQMLHQSMFTLHERFPEIEDMDNLSTNVNSVYKTINNLNSFSIPSDLIQSMASIFGVTLSSDDWGNLVKLEKLQQTYLDILDGKPIFFVVTKFQVKKSALNHLSEFIAWYKNLKRLMYCLRQQDAIVKIRQASLYNLHNLPLVSAIEILADQGLFDGDVKEMRDLLQGKQLGEKDVGHLTDILKYFSSNQTLIECHSEHGLVVKGRFVWFGDFVRNKKLTTGCGNGSREKVVVLSSDTVVFDQDFESDKIESFVVLAPYWEVMDKRELKFSGKDAKDDLEDRPSGGPGGSFYGANKFRINGGAIFIASYGGNGGIRGQTCGVGGFPGYINISCGDNSCHGVKSILKFGRNGDGAEGESYYIGVSDEGRYLRDWWNLWDRRCGTNFSSATGGVIPHALNYSMFIAMYQEFLKTLTDARQFSRDFASELTHYERYKEIRKTLINAEVASNGFDGSDEDDDGW